VSCAAIDMVGAVCGAMTFAVMGVAGAVIGVTGAVIGVAGTVSSTVM